MSSIITTDPDTMRRRLECLKAAVAQGLKGSEAAAEAARLHDWVITGKYDPEACPPDSCAD
jgi:hypothetical protein